MSDFTKIILIISVILGIIALTFYAYINTQKLDDRQLDKVESNIEEHLPSDLEDLYDNEEEEAIDEESPEDDDFEEYIEPGEDWVEEDTVIEDPVPTIQKTDESQAYLLIAGSYKSRKNANSKIKSMEELGLDAEIVQIKDSDLFMVCIGRFESESIAKQTSEKYKSDLDVKSYVREKRD